MNLAWAEDDPNVQGAKSFISSHANGPFIELRQAPSGLDCWPRVQVATFDALAAPGWNALVGGVSADARNSSQPTTRLQAPHLLNQSRNAHEQSVRVAVRDAVKDPEPTLSAYAVLGLVRCGGKDGTGALSEAFRSGDASTKLMVI